MPQLRVTKKFATDCKIKSLCEPMQTYSLFDDWVIDVIRVDRKKVAMVTHIHTLLTFLIPYADVGGAKNIPARISVLLKKFLQTRGYSGYEKEITTLFEKPLLFCKTQNRHVLGHMNDLKFAVKASTYQIPFNLIRWDDLQAYLHQNLMNVANLGYIRPLKLVDQMLSKKPHLPIME